MTPEGFTMTGPFFELDTTREVDKMLRDTVQETVDRGESEVRDNLRPGRGVLSGGYRRTVQGKVRGTKGSVAGGSGIIGTWLEGTSRRNQTTRFRGYGTWRQARQRTERRSGDIFERRADRMVAKLNGGIAA